MRRLIYYLLFFLQAWSALAFDLAVEDVNLNELLRAHEQAQLSPENISTLGPLHDVTVKVIEDHKTISAAQKRRLEFFNNHLNSYLKVAGALENCGDHEDSRGISMAANIAASHSDACANQNRHSSTLPASNLFSELRQGPEQLNEALLRNILNEELLNATLEDSLRSKITTAELFAFSGESKESICQDIKSRFARHESQIKKVCDQPSTKNQKSFENPEQALEALSTKAKAINEKLSVVQQELNTLLNDYRKEHPRSNVRDWRQLVLDVGPTLPSYLEYLAEYDKQTSDQIGRLILVEPMDKRFGPPFQFDAKRTPNPLGNAEGGVTFTPPIHASKNYLYTPTENVVDITSEDIIETVDNLKESSSDAFDRIERALKNGNGQQASLQMTMDLIKANPYSLGNVLMRNPQLGELSCHAIAEIKKRDRRRELLFKTVDYVSLGIGLVPVFGWGASLATKGGSLALRGLSTTARLASSRAVGAVVGLSTAGEIFNVGQKLSHYSDIMSTLEFSFQQAPNSSDQLYEQFKTARDELDQAILEAKLTGAFLGFSSAFVARNLVVSARGMEPSKVIEAIRRKTNEIRRIGSGQRSSVPPHLAARAPLSPSQIHHEVYGDLSDGRPTIFMIHGRDDSMRTFRKNLELQDEFNIVTLDLRGFGQTSSSNVEDLNLATMAGDIKVLMDSLGVENAHFVAHSMGARVSAKFKDLYPNRMRSLIAEDMEMHARFPLADSEISTVVERARGLSSRASYSSQDEIAEVLKEVGYDENMSRLMASRLSVENPDGTLSLRNIEPGDSYLFTRLSGTENLLPGLRQHSSMPMLFMRADPTISASFSDEGVRLINEALPNVRIQNFPGARHAIHSSHPSEYNDSVREFLRSLSN